MSNTRSLAVPARLPVNSGDDSLPSDAPAMNTPQAHALHSPNLSKEQLTSYLNSTCPPRNPNSLSLAHEHDPQLVSLVNARPHISLVRLLIKSAEDVIRINNEAPTIPLPSPPITPVKGTFSDQQQASQPSPVSHVYNHPKWKKLDNFILGLIEVSNARVSTLVVTLVYLHRLKAKLPPMAQGMPCTRHRVFLAALVVAAKYLNDSTPKNKHWSIYSRVFDTPEINLMEKQMLQLLNFDLRVTEDEILAHVQPLLSGRSARRDAVKKATQATAARQARDYAQMPITPPHDAVPSLRSRQVNNVSAPPQAVIEREDKRVQDVESNFVLKPVPFSARRKSISRSSSNSSVSDLLSVSQSAPVMQCSSSSGSSAVSSVVSLAETNSSDRAMVHVQEEAFGPRPLREKVLGGSGINSSNGSPFAKAVFDVTGLSNIAPSASLPTFGKGSMFSRWIPQAVRRGRKGTE